MLLLVSLNVPAGITMPVFLLFFIRILSSDDRNVTSHKQYVFNYISVWPNYLYDLLNRNFETKLFNNIIVVLQEAIVFEHETRRTVEYFCDHRLRFRSSCVTIRDRCYRSPWFTLDQRSIIVLLVIHDSFTVKISVVE